MIETRMEEFFGGGCLWYSCNS